VEWSGADGFVCVCVVGGGGDDGDKGNSIRDKMV
jgi:hypothetical protein